MTQPERIAPKDRRIKQPMPLTFLEFFAGGGMARAGLGRNWRCLFANDFDPMKRDVYVENFGRSEFVFGDVAELGAAHLPDERADAAWASFPCQDLSLAGGRKGLRGERSGAFFGFMRVVDDLRRAKRAPRTIILENVAGLLNSRGGADFENVVQSLKRSGYRVAAKIVDARDFAPQSRPRLFIFGFGPDARVDPAMIRPVDAIAAPQSRNARAGVPADYNWLRPAPVGGRNTALADIVDWSAPWDAPERTRRLIDAMAPRHRERVNAIAKETAQTGGREAGCAYRRVRVENGRKVVRVEPRFDGVAGCLRTPAGGSSRQFVVCVEAGEVRTRLMTAPEAARAMGLPGDYRLPASTTAALRVIGDGVAPPVVRWIADAILEPALDRSRSAAHKKPNGRQSRKSARETIERVG